jgi:hypothetical protein
VGHSYQSGEKKDSPAEPYASGTECSQPASQDGEGRSRQEGEKGEEDSQNRADVTPHSGRLSHLIISVSV